MKEVSETSRKHSVARLGPTTDMNVFDEHKESADGPLKRSWRNEKKKNISISLSEEVDQEEISASGGWDVVDLVHEAMSDTSESQTPNFEEGYEITLE